MMNSRSTQITTKVMLGKNCREDSSDRDRGHNKGGGLEKNPSATLAWTPIRRSLGNSTATVNSHTLGDVLKALADHLPHEVELCGALLEALRRADGLSGLCLGAAGPETGRIISVVRESFLRGEDTKTPPPPRNLGLSSVVGHTSLIDTELTCPDSPAYCVGPVDTDNEPEPRRRGTPFLPDKSHGGLRQRAFVLFDDASQSVCGRIMDMLLAIAIAVSTVSFILESEPSWRRRSSECSEGQRTVANCEPQPVEAFFFVELVCIVLFTLDYGVRVLTVHSVSEDMNRVCGGLLWTLMYAKQPLNVIDVLAILPFYLNLIIGGKGGALRVLRLFRILRLFKAAKHHKGIRMLTEVMAMSGQPLMILMFFNAIITVLFASLIYFAEGVTFSVAPEFTNNTNSEQPGGAVTNCNDWVANTANYYGDEDNPHVPDYFPCGVYVRSDKQGEGDEVSPYRSIPVAIWWVLTTSTTVGYGDMSPTTLVGKVIGIACFYVGIIFLALPISVLGTNFELVYNRHQVAEEKRRQHEVTGCLWPLIAKKIDALLNKASEPENRWKRKQTNVVMETPFLPRCAGIRAKTFMVLDDGISSRLGKYYSVFVIGTILVSTTSFVMETMPRFREVPEACAEDGRRPSVKDCTPQPYDGFLRIEAVCIVVFTVDYLLRVATSHAAPPMPGSEASSQAGKEDPPIHPLKKTFRYSKQPLNIIDFLAIVPFYVEQASGGGGGAAVLRVLRLVRIFRVMKMPKMRACADMFVTVIQDALPAVLLVFFVTMLMCVLFASLIVFAEGSWYSVDHFVEAHPDGVYVRPTTNGYGLEVSPFQSILYAFWWFFTTATTVGYGDDYPTTTAGRIVGVMTFYTGIVLFSLPITVVGGSFQKYYPTWIKEFGHNYKGIEAENSEQILMEVRHIEAAAAQKRLPGYAFDDNDHLSPPPSTPVADDDVVVQEAAPHGLKLTCFGEVVSGGGLAKPTQIVALPPSEASPRLLTAGPLMNKQQNALGSAILQPTWAVPQNDDMDVMEADEEEEV